MAETTAPAATGWSFSKMLEDPNFHLLLANMGKAADPEGAGGVIGGAAANMISSKAAQTAIEKRDAARSAQIQKLIDLHGGITKPDSPGLNSIKSTPSGSFTFDLNLPEPRNITGTPEFGAFTRSLSDFTPRQAAPAPAITPATTAPVPVTPPARPVTRVASARVPDITDIAPFY